jgi:hypothetical protein
MAARLGASANWCTFATWASRQAGQSIRREDLQRAIDHGLDAWIGAGAADTIGHAARALGADQTISEIRSVVRATLGSNAAIARTAAAVARGNLKVFAEIGREFARFLTVCFNDSSPVDAHIEAFVGGLRGGHPPDGQRYLQQAFRRYYRALFEPDSAQRTQQLLLANLEIGFHEQTRLQPEIAEALDAGVIEARELAPKLLRQLFPRGGIVVRVRRFFLRLFGGRTPLDHAAEALVAEARAVIRRIITDHLMTLELSSRLLHLGTDLRSDFPARLSRLDDPELLALLAHIDPTPDSLRQSGARDWANLPDRLHFIADLFRCYHDTVDLFDPPFPNPAVAAR